MLYVWATEQDSFSKRVVPVQDDARKAQDVLVPWVHSAGVHQRFYHLFTEGELRLLVAAAAAAMGLKFGAPVGNGDHGVEIVQDGWERSNWYIELRRWKS
jgi:tRNA (uracil-5-)-methyltransferase TRM9